VACTPAFGGCADRQVAVYSRALYIAIPRTLENACDGHRIGGPIMPPEAHRELCQNYPTHQTRQAGQRLWGRSRKVRTHQRRLAPL